MSSDNFPDTIPHPFSPAGRRCPYPAYQWLTENEPLHYDPSAGMWFIAGHKAAAAALRDSRFSAALGQRQRLREDGIPPSMLSTDGAEHARLRAPGARLLGPAAVRSISQGVAADIRLLTAGLKTTGEVDVHTDIAIPLALAVFCRLLQIEPDQRPAFAALAHRVSVNLDPFTAGAAAADGRAAARELTDFIGRHVDRLLGIGADGPLTRMAADRRLARADMLGIVSLAVIGGYSPLAELLSNALYLQVRHPELATASSASATAMAGAIEEALRLEAPIPFTSRVATADVRLPGGEIPAGARVLVLLAAAGRDPVVFANPATPEPGRSPNPHLAFGAGPHFCLGAPLVRLAAGQAVAAILRDFPRLRLAGPAEWSSALLPRRLANFRLTMG